MVEEGLANYGFDQLVMYQGAYEEVHGGVTSWIEDGGMVHNHHWSLRGSMLPLLHNGGAHVVVVVLLIEQLVAFMTPDSRVVDRLG